MSSQQETATGQRIVVGVDGSARSKAALAWAVREAELTGATVEAVMAWHYPAMYGGYAWAPVAAMEAEDFRTVSAHELSKAIAETTDPAGPVKISTTVREGDAAEVLLDVADGADMLVVGSRGHSGFTGALLGSVSQHCAHHAPCPIVIIRGTSSH
jgi:nucleotide-binding universal stress UspA family protein